MAMNLRGRLTRLERVERGRAGCPGCGWGGGGPVTFTCGPIRIIGDPPDPGDDPSMDTCPTCGRRVVLRIPSPNAIIATVPRPAAL
jgi:anaerobic selenocysteine-containing dehydrogenase